MLSLWESYNFHTLSTQQFTHLGDTKTWKKKSEILFVIHNFSNLMPYNTFNLKQSFSYKIEPLHYTKKEVPVKRKGICLHYTQKIIVQIFAI